MRYLSTPQSLNKIALLTTFNIIPYKPISENFLYEVAEVVITLQKIALTDAVSAFHLPRTA